LRRLAAEINAPLGFTDKKGFELDKMWLPGGIEMTEEWRVQMERVNRETEEAYEVQEREGTWFSPEYYAFKERRE
jgi:hypothetical protein